MGVGPGLRGGAGHGGRAGLAGCRLAPVWAASGPIAYVTNPGSNTVSVINTATNTVVGGPIPVSNNPNGVAITPDGRHAYIANLLSNNVSVIDTGTNVRHRRRLQCAAHLSRRVCSGVRRFHSPHVVSK